MALITHLAEGNQPIQESLIDTLEGIADVKVVAHAVIQAEAGRWLPLHDGTWPSWIFSQGERRAGVLTGCRHREHCQKAVMAGQPRHVHLKNTGALHLPAHSSVCAIAYIQTVSNGLI